MIAVSHRASPTRTEDRRTPSVTKPSIAADGGPVPGIDIELQPLDGVEGKGAGERKAQHRHRQTPASRIGRDRDPAQRGIAVAPVEGDLDMADKLTVVLGHPAQARGRIAASFIQHCRHLLTGQREMDKRPTPLNDIRVAAKPARQGGEMIGGEGKEMDHKAVIGAPACGVPRPVVPRWRGRRIRRRCCSSPASC